MATGKVIFNEANGTVSIVPDSPIFVECPLCHKIIEVRLLGVKPDNEVNSLGDLANKKLKVSFKCTHCGKTIGGASIETGDIDDIVCGPASMN